MGWGKATSCYAPDGRVYVGPPVGQVSHNLAWPRTTQDAPEHGGNSPTMYSTGPGKRGESMWNQPAFRISPGMPAQQAQPDIARDLYEVGGSAFPTFFPIGNRAVAGGSTDTGGNYETMQYLLLPPDRYNAAANSRGGNRRGPHDVRLKGFTGPPASRRRIPGLAVGA